MAAYGTNGSDWLDAFDGVTNGADQVYGYDGKDTLFGLGGNDILKGGGGSDHLFGGDGKDTASYEGSPAGVYVDLMNNVALWGDADGDTFDSIENLTGSARGDDLTGDTGDNVLRGLDGSDQLWGHGGADTLWGGDGHDEISGGNSVDTLFGEFGNDVLWGGYGLDHLYGGLGADTFMWDFVGETSVSTVLADVILDFRAADGDLIDLDSVDADVYAPGYQDFTFIGAAAFTLNAATPDPTDLVPGEIRYYHAGGDTFIEMQTGKSGDIEGVIRIAGMVTPEASWFVL
jgi:Ca2+-binding RTX toxin-like protein